MNSEEEKRENKEVRKMAGCKGDKVSSERGVALIAAVMAVAVLMAIGLSFAFNMRLEEKAAVNYMYSVTAKYIAEAGVEYAIALLRNDTNGYDSYGEGWHTSFTGTVVDNDGDGTNDSKWSTAIVINNNLLAQYAIYVVDEASKININAAGNIAGAGDTHADNQGWTVAEIDLICLPGIGTTLHENIVKYRYGDDNLPGGSVDDDNDATPIEDDGIDNDGDSSIDSSDTNEGDDEPDEFVPDNPYGDDTPFITPEQIKLVSGIISSGIWSDISNLITIYSRDTNQYYDGSNWQDRININAVKSSYDLYNMINSLDDYSTPEGQRYAANIIDYADIDYVPTVCYDGSTPYYGIEGLQINEVMTNVTGIPRENDASYVTLGGAGWTRAAPEDSGKDGNSSTWSWPWDNGTYVVDIYADITPPVPEAGTRKDFQYNAEGQTGSGNATVTGVSITVSDNKIDLQITDGDETGGATKEWTTNFDKIVVHAGDFVEIVNVSDLSIDINPNWDLVGGTSGTHDLLATTTTFTHLIIANSLYAIDYIYGNDDGTWAGGGDENGEIMVISSMNLEDAGEDLTLRDGNGDIIDVAPLNDGSGTIGYGIPSQDISRARPSPINDTSAWADSTTASAGTYKCTIGGDNDGTPADKSSWNVHDGPFASIGMIGDVPKGTGDTATLEDTVANPDIQNFADKLTIVAQRLEGEDASTIPWGASVGTGIDGTDLYEAPGATGSWEWIWTDDGTGNFRLIDGTYHLFICGDYPNYDFECPAGTQREVRPSCLAYAGEVTVTGKELIVTIDGNTVDTPRLDYVLLTPTTDSPGTLGRININTASNTVLQALPGIEVGTAGDIITDREGVDGPFETIGELLDVPLIGEATFAPLSNLITVRSDVFEIICTGQAWRDLNGDGSIDSGDERLAERKIKTIVDRGTAPISIRYWREVTE